MRTVPLLTVVLALVAPAAHAAEMPATDQPGPVIGGGHLVEQPLADAPPPGFNLSSRDAVRIADAHPDVEAERAKRPLRIRVLVGDRRVWSVRYRRASTPVVEAEIDDRTRSVVTVWTGVAASWPLARGERGPAARRLHIALIVAAVLFVLPFMDPRRPFRMLHLDLLALLAFGISHVVFLLPDMETAYPLAYPVLAYLVVRLAWVALRPRAPDGPLLPFLPVWALAGALVLVVAGRIAFNIFGDLGVMEGGYDSVWGADTITGGWDLYVPSGFPLNVYGPMTYLAYVPFELVFPLGENWQRDSLPAAHAAAITWDLATIVGLYFLGRRMRDGADGTRMGLALAFAWATYPYTLWVVGVSTNDALVPALLVWTLVMAGSAAGRGLLLGLACTAKLFPLPLIAVFARGPGERWGRTQVIFAAVLVATMLVAVVPYLPHPGGFGQFWDLTVQANLDRDSPFSLWGLHPSLAPLQDALRIAVAALAVAFAFVPRERTLPALAAAGGALIAGQQLFLDHWYYLYISWFAAFAFVAFFARATTHRASA